MKILPPTLREKKRYVAFEVLSDEQISKDELRKAVWIGSLSLLGEIQASALGLYVLDLESENQQGFLVCRNEASWKIKAVLALLGEINGKKAHISVTGVSGTIKALKRKFLNTESVIIQEKRYNKLLNLEIVREYGDCVDALPKNKELLSRLKDLKMKYIGLMRSDLEVESSLGGN